MKKIEEIFLTTLEKNSPIEADTFAGLKSVSESLNLFLIGK